MSVVVDREVSPFVSKVAQGEAEHAVREHEERYHAERFLEVGARRSLWERAVRWLTRRGEGS